MATSNQYQRVVPFILFALALLLFFLLIQPTISILLGAILLAYVTHPLRRKVRKIVPNESVAIILSILIIVVIILIPFTLLAVGVAQEGYQFYNSLSGNIAKGALFGLSCTSEDSTVCSLLNQAENFNLQSISSLGIDMQLQRVLVFFEGKITAVLLDLPILIAQFVLTVVISYFILRGWEAILRSIVDLLPMRKKTIQRIIGEFGGIAYTVIYAQLFVAAVQGVVAIIGFYAFGVPFPLLLGTALAFAALIPTIGTAIIWVPASLFLILGGAFTKNYWVLGKGIGLLLYGMLLISTIDNFLLSRIVHVRTNVSQILVIVGVIGGMGLFGFIGIFVGPILLPLLVTYFETFKERFV